MASVNIRHLQFCPCLITLHIVLPPGLIIINQVDYRVATVVSVIPLCGGNSTYESILTMHYEISPILNEASSAAEKSILPIARLIPRHADAIYRVNLNVRGTQHGQNHFGNVIRIEWAAAVHLCSMEGEGRDPAPGVCYCKAALLRFPSAGSFLFLFIYLFLACEKRSGSCLRKVYPGASQIGLDGLWHNEENCKVNIFL